MFVFDLDNQNLFSFLFYFDFCRNETKCFFSMVEGVHTARKETSQLATHTFPFKGKLLSFYFLKKYVNLLEAQRKYEHTPPSLKVTRLEKLESGIVIKSLIWTFDA